MSFNVTHGLVAKHEEAFWSTSLNVLRDVPQADVRRDGPLPGLPNLGNTCFMNSVLQCLFNTPGDFTTLLHRLLDQTAHPSSDVGPSLMQSLVRIFRPPQEDELSIKLAVLRCFVELLRHYRSAMGQLSTRPLEQFKRSMARFDGRYASFEQQDAYEFLTKLFEGLDQSLGVQCARRQCQFVHSVCGVSLSTLRQCHRCLEFATPQVAQELALGLPTISAEAQFNEDIRAEELVTPVTVLELLRRTQAPEDITDYDCDRCRDCAAKQGLPAERSTMTQRVQLAEGHGVLLLALYRFLNVLDSSGSFEQTKLKREVLVPTVLSLKTGDYRLYGVVSHCGASLSAGHYVAAVRSQRDGLWYECSDTQVRPMEGWNPDVVSSFSRIQSGSDPVLLFYDRICAVDAPQGVDHSRV